MSISPSGFTSHGRPGLEPPSLTPWRGRTWESLSLRRTCPLWCLGYLPLLSYFVRHHAGIVIMKKLSYPKSLSIVLGLHWAVLSANVNAQDAPAGDAARGKAFFEISCAVCHSPVLGPDNLILMKQGPSLVGVVGRAAGSQPHFNYTKAIRDSGFTWDAV